jgi:hypothetical protein
MYLLLLGVVNLLSRPFLTTGGRDLAALAVAVSGFVAAGPMELFLPEWTAARFGGYAVWGLMLGLYALLVTLLVLLMRPRLVIYNVLFEQLRPVLAEVVSRLDPDARWAGESLVMPQLGVHLHMEPLTLAKNVQLVASGPHQSYEGWRRLEMELASGLKQIKTSGNRHGWRLLAFGVALAVVITYGLVRDPQQVAQSMEAMLRQTNDAELAP